ncbi:ABC transporter permease [Sedimentibacter saalensis]|uniref:Fluoroquinolone transport system permease protein n=1 Tax=Sedimentibacter saalensis TaxID=130788 RepID=A0A562JF40_9FIRM|nr:ABC transporter permease [Sedimentibacter saalensis]TWH81791.1 fluoroquinolone transport system permease protein [Sedimentibacter saalensis]
MTHKRLSISFMQYLNQIARDAMLFLSCLAPVLYGLFMKFGIPAAEKFLTGYYSREEVLVPYFLIFDLFLVVLTPMMFSFASSMVILGEIDDGITKYMSVTPLGRGGYLISRLILPLTLSFVVSIIVMNVFSLDIISFEMIILLSFLSSVLGFITTMMVVSLSANKVEGMAITKMSGISMIGIILPFFVLTRIQYLAIMLPSFWMAKFALEGKITYLILCVMVSAGWILLLLRKFMKKTM